MVSRDLVKKLEEKVYLLENTCYRFKSDFIEKFPCKPHNDDGDATLFNGLLASTGYVPAYKAVYDSQGKTKPYEGMFFRSPRRRLTENQGFSHFFSRDMSLGVLLVLACEYGSEHVKSQMAKDWIKWINKNRECKVKKPWGNGCLIRGLYRFAPDDRSLINPNMWALMGRVWDFNGWDKHSQMKKWKGWDGDGPLQEAKLVKLGFRLHLKAVQSYLKLRIGQSKEYQHRMAEICYKRQPANLFYKFLYQKNVTDDDVKLFFNWAPTSLDANRNKCWAWEQSNIQHGILNSCGWDFVFLGRLYLNKIKFDKI